MINDIDIKNIQDILEFRQLHYTTGELSLDYLLGLSQNELENLLKNPQEEQRQELSQITDTLFKNYGKPEDNIILFEGGEKGRGPGVNSFDGPHSAEMSWWKNKGNNEYLQVEWAKPVYFKDDGEQLESCFSRISQIARNLGISCPENSFIYYDELQSETCGYHGLTRDHKIISFLTNGWCWITKCTTLFAL